MIHDVTRARKAAIGAVVIFVAAAILAAALASARLTRLPRRFGWRAERAGAASSSSS
jgi:ABC-type transporter Mla subunit MlaD